MVPPEDGPGSLMEIWELLVLEVGAEGWKAQGSLGMKAEFSCGAEQGAGEQ